MSGLQPISKYVSWFIMQSTWDNCCYWICKLCFCFSASVLVVNWNGFSNCIVTADDVGLVRSCFLTIRTYQRDRQNTLYKRCPEEIITFYLSLTLSKTGFLKLDFCITYLWENTRYWWRNNYIDIACCSTDKTYSNSLSDYDGRILMVEKNNVQKTNPTRQYDEIVMKS